MVFVSYCEILLKIIVLISAKTEENSVDFCMNICHAMVSTFKEDGLCIERLWVS